MSQLTLFIVGTIVFAITVYGTVMAGGIALGRVVEREDDNRGQPAAGPAEQAAQPVAGDVPRG